MDKELAEYFFDKTSKEFAFLLSQYEFRGPELEIDHKIHFAFATFSGRNLALQFILDERESDLDCEIVRLVRGRKPEPQGTDERGIRMREYLTATLGRRGATRSLFRKVNNLPLREQIPITLEDFALALRQYGGDILADSPTALDH